jgi:hypothetical protein
MVIYKYGFCLSCFTFGLIVDLCFDCLRIHIENIIVEQLTVATNSRTSFCSSHTVYDSLSTALSNTMIKIYNTYFLAIVSTIGGML